MRSISIKSRPTFTRTPGGTREPPRSSPRRRPARRRPRRAASRNFPVRTSTVPEPCFLRAADVGLDVVSHHHRLGGRRSELGERRVEVRSGRLADDLGLDPRRVLEARNERAAVQARPARGLPPAVAVQTDETRPGVELGKRTVQVLVAEDAPGLLGLVRPAEERPRRRVRRARSGHRDRPSSARGRACPRAGVRRRPGSSSARRPRARRPARSSPASCRRPRVVLFVTKRRRCPSALGHRDPGARHGLARHVQDAVNVEQNRRHAPRVYSRPPRTCDPAGRDRHSHVALQRAGRPARPEDRDPRRGELRRRCFGDAHQPAEGAHPDGLGSGGPRRRTGRAKPVAQPRARSRAAGCRPARGTSRRAPTASGDAYKGVEERRLGAKRVRSKTKRLRRPPEDE